jgi:hypothetical protein
MFLEFHCSLNHPAEAEEITSSFHELGEMPMLLSSLLQHRDREETGPGNPEQDVDPTVRRHFVTHPNLRYLQRFRSMIRDPSPASVASTEDSTPTCPVAADVSTPVELAKRTGNLMQRLNSIGA